MAVTPTGQGAVPGGQAPWSVSIDSVELHGVSPGDPLVAIAIRTALGEALAPHGLAAHARAAADAVGAQLAKEAS